MEMMTVDLFCGEGIPTTFERGIRETVRWYLDNQPWVKTVLNR